MNLKDLRALAEGEEPAPVKPAAPAPAAAEIFIYGMIGGWDYDAVSAATFCQEFRQLEAAHDRINVRINSPGGSVFEGLAIYNAIARSPKEVHTYIDGNAWSMAGIIAMAGRQVHAARASMLMLHNASGFVVGHAQDLRETAEELDKWDRIIAEGLAIKTGKTVDEVLSTYFDFKDHWLPAAEAQTLGLVDILEEVAAVPAPAPLPDPAAVENLGFSERIALFAKPQPKNTGGFLSSIKNLFAGNTPGTPGAPKPAPAASTGRKIYSQADLDTQIQNLATAHEKALFEASCEAEAAKREAEKWQNLAEVYGSQPGAMPSAPKKRNGDDFSGETQNHEVPQLYWEAHDITRSQPKG